MPSDGAHAAWIGVAAFAAARGGDAADAYAMQRWLGSSELPADAGSAFMQLQAAWDATR